MTKLKICPCTVNDGNITPEKSKAFEVMLNPNKFTHNYTISYDMKECMGQLGSDLKFNAIHPGSLDFEILLDNTGVVKGSSDVQTQIEKLNKVIYKYDGSKHEPNHVQLIWGKIIAYGRLTKMDISYTLFTPKGVPLRANINLSFKGFMSNPEQVKRANKSSPDMTHIVEFKAGDSLPLLCHRIYNDSTRYVSVARINNMTSFRSISPGTQILFPPLR